MKNVSMAIAAATLVASTAAALADRPGADWIPPEKVIQQLTAQGYTNFGKVEADDGHWELEADQGGVRYDLDVDPRTGAVIKRERDND